MTRTCWVVSPMLHDTESFLRVRDETTAACRGESLHFVVIDDSAGTDDDVGRLAGLADVEVMTPPFNLGHQGAIVYALRSITERVGDDDRIVTMDSDGEDQPADVPRLLAALDADHHTVLALAQRTQRSESITFRAMYFVYRLVFRLLTGTTVRSGNFAAQKAPSLVSTIHHPSFDLCYSSSLLVLRRPTVKVPCARGTRFAGSSRMNAHSLMAHGIRMLLPLSERIAVRMMVLSVVAAIKVVFWLAVVAFWLPDGDAADWVIAALVTWVVIFLSSLIAFFTLFPRFAGASR